MAVRGLERQDAELKRHMDVLERPLTAILHLTSHGFPAPLFERPFLLFIPPLTQSLKDLFRISSLAQTAVITSQRPE